MLRGKVGSKHNSHIRFLVAYEMFCVLGSVHCLCDGEILRLREPLHRPLRLQVHLRCHHHSAHVLHVGGDGEAEYQHHHHWHTEEYEHRALVAQDMPCFLYYKGYKLFHNSQSPLLASLARQVNT